MPRRPRGCATLLGMRRLADRAQPRAGRSHRKGEVDLQTPGLSEHLWQTTMDKLAVDQPNYASYKRELGKGDSADITVIAACERSRLVPGITDASLARPQMGVRCAGSSPSP